MKFYALLLRIIDAFRHVRTGGRTTRTAATRRATAPPARCGECHQEVKHSPDWRDHLHNR